MAERLAMDQRDETTDGWKADARCRGVDPALLYPDDEDVAGVARAKALCAACPVQSQCLEHALLHREKDGVWGGLTARERQRLIRRRRREAA
jgi:WhiB family redox-sensing transcriptional regulator